jgi:hypothetical protein
MNNQITSRWLVSDTGQAPLKLQDGAALDRLAKSGRIGRVVEVTGDPRDGAMQAADRVGNSRLTDEGAVAALQRVFAHRARHHHTGRLSNVVSSMVAGRAAG